MNESQKKSGKWTFEIVEVSGPTPDPTDFLEMLAELLVDEWLRQNANNKDKSDSNKVSDD